MLSEKHGKKLLALARKAIASRLGKETETAEESDPAWQEYRGTFVTLKKEGALRGCIGNIEPVRTIEEGVWSNAVSAAFNDHRFSPLDEEEFARIDISLSILTEPEPLEYSDADDLCAKLRPGVDGVILRQGRASATFLPQVWQQLPQVDQFLSHLCHKAGLAQNAWREGGVEIATYQVQNFSEVDK